MANGTHLAAVSSTTVPLLRGDAGVEQTVALIFDAWRRAVQDSVVNFTALRIVHGTPVDDVVRARSIFDWVNRNITFVNDPWGHETVRDARFTIEAGAGDCDDIGAVTMPSLFLAIGIRCRLVTIAVDPDRIVDGVAEMSHIYAEALLTSGGQSAWVPLDTARSGAQFAQAIPESRWLRPALYWEPDFEGNAGVSGFEGEFVEQAIPPTLPFPSSFRTSYNFSPFNSPPSGMGLGAVADFWDEDDTYGPTLPDNYEYYDPGTDTTYTYNAGGEIVNYGGRPESGGGGNNISAWTPQQIAAALAAGGNAAANVIRALNASPVLPQGFSRNIQGQIVGPDGRAYSASVSASSFGSFFGNMQPAMIALIVVGGIVLVKGRS